MTWRFDAHVHTGHSKDGRGSVLELAVAAQEHGMHGFAVTDHDTIAGHAEIEEAMQKTGLLIVPGIEVTTAEGHVLALNVREDIQKGQSLTATMAAIEARGGIGIVAHPLRMFTGIGPSGLRTHTGRGTIKAVEAHNARERRIVQENTQSIVATLGVPMVGGSDAHWVHDVGTAYTEFDHAPQDAGEVVRSIRDGLCRPAGGNLSRRQVWGHGLSLTVRRFR